MGLELIQPGLHRDDRLPPKPEHPNPGVVHRPFIGDEPRLQQHPQVLAHRRRVDTEALRQITGPARPVAEQLHGPEPGRVAEGLQQRSHSAGGRALASACRHPAIFADRGNNVNRGVGGGRDPDRPECDTWSVMAFADRFDSVRCRFGPLVWGLDPSGVLLDLWGVGDNPDGLDRFVDIVLEAATGTVGIVKPQSAFYERQGWRGIRSLTRLCADARAAELLVILDAKRGDVGSTNDAYAEAYLGKDAPIEADAVTVHPYLGLGAMRAFIDRAAEAGGCLLVVTRSSNPEGRSIQAAVDSSGHSVEAGLLRHIGEINADLAPGRIGPIGAVVAPVNLQPDLDLSAARALFLAPGVGAQGATVEDVARTFSVCPARVMPSASRSLLTHGPDIGALRDAVGSLANEFRERLVEKPGGGSCPPP
jgi:orotidine-5'-phosphate decarboxylase